MVRSVFGMNGVRKRGIATASQLMRQQSSPSTVRLPLLPSEPVSAKAAHANLLLRILVKDCSKETHVTVQWGRKRQAQRLHLNRILMLLHRFHSTSHSLRRQWTP
jgi:hypothetical protein